MEDHVAYITAITESAWSNLTPLERKQIREALAALEQELAETREREMAWNYAALDEKARASSLETALREIAEGKEREPVKGTTGVSGRPRYRYELAARLRASAALGEEETHD